VVRPPEITHDEFRLSIMPVRSIPDSFSTTAPAAPPWWTTIHAAFDRIVERFPHSPAVEQGGRCGQVRTYEQLARASQCLAADLTAAGVRPGDVVGVSVGRSAEFVACLLAILRCGAAYAPLPGEYPLPRLLGMLDDAKIGVVVADAASRPLVDALEGERGALARVEIDAAGIWDRAFPDEAPTEIGIGPESPAYVMFTSGSTGRPRGVVIPHRAVAGLVIGQSFADFGPGLRTLLLAPTAFDASTFEIWAPLLHGGTAVVYPGDDFVPDRLGEILRAGRVNCLWLTAGLFNLVVDLLPSALEGVAHVLTGGDVLSIPHVRRAFAALPGIRITNGYGPTETTTFACTHAIDPTDPFPDGTIPIGRELAHSECLIVDEAGRPVPDGVEGELLIGGSGVALGFLADDGAKFVADPRGTGSGRWYRSGDRCRRRADGNFMFLGRLDRELKIRGHRVDPAELEAVLAGHPQLRAAAAVPYGPAGDRSLGVAVVRRDGGTGPVDGLRDWVAERVPPALVPARIVRVAALPVTPNGKLDRDALPALLERTDREKSLAVTAAPRGAVESTVAEIWRALLGGAPVGRDDDFFDRGGNSLSAMRMVARIERATGVRLGVRTVFDRPRLADLAQAIAHPADVVDALPSSATLTAAGPLELPALPAQRGMWVLQQLLPDPVAYNQPFAFRPRGPVDWVEFRRRLRASMDRHAALRTALVETVDGIVQRVTPPDGVALPWEEDPTVAPEGIERALAERSRVPFDLAATPLWRAVLFPSAATHGVLLLLFHHAIVDEWSIALLLDELAADAVSDLPAPLARLPTGGDEAAALRHWSESLAGAPVAVAWPGDRPSTGSPAGRGALVRFTIPSAVVEAWGRIARSRQATLFHAWLGACHLWLQRENGCRDTVVLTPLANRAGAEASEALGCLLNTLPIRLRRSGDSATAAGMTAAARDAFLASLGHGFLPYDRIVAAVPGAAGSRLQPLGNVAFVYVERDGGEPRPAGVPFEPIHVHTGTARFDLTLSLYPVASGGDAEGVVEYSCDVLDEATVRKMVKRWLRLLEAGAGDQDLDLAVPSGIQAPVPAASAVASPSSGRLPQGATEATVAAVWADALGVDVVHRDDHFFELGGNSLLAIRILHRLERETGTRVPLRSLFVAPRLIDFAAIVERALAGGGTTSVSQADAGPAPAAPRSGDPVAAQDQGAIDRAVLHHGVLVPLRPEGSEAPLFLCHGVEGGISHFLRLAEMLGAGIPVYGLIARGLEGVLPDHPTLEAMIGEYVDEILRLRPSGPIHLAGWSAGGWYAYEVAREVRRRGRTVGLLGLLDTHRSPRLPAAVAMATLLPRWKAIVANRWARLRETRWAEVPRKAKRVARLLSRRLAPAAQRRGAATDPYLAVLLAHQTGTYDGDIDLFTCRGTAGDTVPMWRSLCSGEVRVHGLPGRHGSMLHGESGRRVVDVWREVILSARGSAGDAARESASRSGSVAARGPVG